MEKWLIGLPGPVSRLIVFFEKNGGNQSGQPIQILRIWVQRKVLF